MSYLEIPYFFEELSIKIRETLQILLCRKNRDTFREIEQQLLLHQNHEKEYFSRRTRSVTLCCVSVYGRKAPSRNFKTGILETESRRYRTKGREGRRLDSYRYLSFFFTFIEFPESSSSSFLVSSLLLLFSVTNRFSPFLWLSVWSLLCLSSHSSFLLLMRLLVFFHLCNRHLFFSTSSLSQQKEFLVFQDHHWTHKRISPLLILLTLLLSSLCSMITFMVKLFWEWLSPKRITISFRHNLKLCQPHRFKGCHNNNKNRVFFIKIWKP